MNIRTCLGLGLLLPAFPALAVDQRAAMEWTGLYAGAKAGYGSGDVKSGAGEYDPAFPFPPTSMFLCSPSNRRGIGAAVWRYE